MKKITAMILMLCLTALVLVPALAESRGVFGELARMEDADERFALLDEIAEMVQTSLTQEDGSFVELSLGLYEENLVFISYRIGAVTDQMVLHEGAPEREYEWTRVLEDWVPGELPPSGYPDVQKENDWLDGKGQRWLEAPYFTVQEGLILEDGSRTDAIAGSEYKLEDGSVIGWREFVIPDEKEGISRTFELAFTLSYAVKFQDYRTFKGYWEDRATVTLPFSLYHYSGHRVPQ